MWAWVEGRKLDLYRRMAQYDGLIVNCGGRAQHGDLFSELIRREFGALVASSTVGLD